MKNKYFLQIIHKRANKSRNGCLLMFITMIITLLINPTLPEANDKPVATPAVLVKALQDRSSEIDEREKDVEKREGRLELLEQEVSLMLDKYIKLKKEADLRESAHVKAAEAEKEKRIKRLAKIYQAMAPKEAASRLRNMKKTTALSLLRKIKEKQAAKILSNLSPKKATEMSESFIKPDK